MRCLSREFARARGFIRLCSMLALWAGGDIWAVRHAALAAALRLRQKAFSPPKFSFPLSCCLKVWRHSSSSSCSSSDEAGFFFFLHCCLRPLLHKTPGRKGRGVVCVRGGRKERKRRAETNAKERRSLPPLPYTDNYVLHIACVRRRRCKPDQNYPSPPPQKKPGKRVCDFCEKKKMRKISQLMKTLCVKYNKGVWTIKKGTPKRDIFHYHGFALSIPQFIVNQFFCLSVHRNRPAPFSCHPW